MLHSDLSERELAASVNQFRDLSNSEAYRQTSEGDVEEDVVVEHPLNILLTTDAPLQSILRLHCDPIGPTLLIHYDLPRRKEEYNKRSHCILGSRTRSGRRRISISFVEAGKIDELQLFEEFADRTLREMPVHVTDIFIT